MNLKMLKASLVGLILSLNGLANAGVIVNGALEPTTNDDGIYFTTVDFWDFSVHSTGIVSFDVLSWEDNFDGTHTDVNSSGDYFYIDSRIWLFTNDGILDSTDFIAENDDGTLGGDGSISTIDSFLSLNLNPGNYILAISSWSNDDPADIIDGKNIGGLYGSLDGGVSRIHNSGNRNPEITHGDYQITFSGDVSVNNITIPEPSTLAIFALGLVGFASRRFKKQA